jgi:osmotically-inducible protein OsmY
MNDYNKQIEAAYLSSKRQGDSMRNRADERSPHQDRRNRARSINERWETRSTFRGIGPRNYRPSDDRIREKISDLFYDHPYLDASGVEVSVQNGEVLLVGFVADRYEKRLAEHLAEKVSGTENVENRLKIYQQTQSTR